MYLSIIQIIAAILSHSFSVDGKNSALPSGIVFQSTGLLLDWSFEIIDVGSHIECAFSLLKQDKFAAFHFKQGRCYLYMLPSCGNFNLTSLMRKRDNTTKVYLKSDGIVMKRSQQPTTNLAYGECVSGYKTSV